MVFPGYQSPPSPPPHLLDLHPVEAMLVLFWISAAALLRLVADPPRPMRYLHGGYVTVSGSTVWGDEMLDALLQAQAIRQPQFDAAWTCHPQASASPAPDVICPSAATAQEWADTHIRHPQASATPAHGIAPGPTVAELRTMARQRGLTQAGSRPIHKARRADLLAALGL